MKIKFITTAIITSLFIPMIANADRDSKDLSITLNNPEWIKVEQPDPIVFNLTAGATSVDLNAAVDICVSANSDYTINLIDTRSDDLEKNGFNLFNMAYSSLDEENPEFLKNNVEYLVKFTHDKVVNGVSNPQVISTGAGNVDGFNSNFDSRTEYPDLDINNFDNTCISLTSGEVMKNYKIEVKIPAEQLTKIRAGSFTNILTIKATNNQLAIDCIQNPSHTNCRT